MISRRFRYDEALRIETEFLIIGAGVAGLRAAIEAAPAGDVLVLTKDRLTESTSEYAQGGIAVALSDDDEVSLHEQDTIQAGAGLCDIDAVRALVAEGPAQIEKLIEWGVPLPELPPTPSAFPASTSSVQAPPGWRG